MQNLLRGSIVRPVLTLFLASMVLCGPASSQETSILPDGLCESLPQVTDPASLRIIRETAPHLFQAKGNGHFEPIGPIRELPLAKASAVMGRAVDIGYSGVDFASAPGFLDNCAYYVSAATLVMIDGEFSLEMATPLSGRDRSDKEFRMTAMILGRSQLSLRYGAARVEYYNKNAKRTMAMREKVLFRLNAVQESGDRVIYFDDINGLSVHTGFPYGWEDVGRIRKRGGRIHSWVVGKWRGGDKAIPISRRQPSSEQLVDRGMPEVGPMAGRKLLRDAHAFEQLRRLAESPALFKSR